jgi:hypothetical protein
MSEFIDPNGLQMTWELQVIAPNSLPKFQGGRMLLAMAVSSQNHKHIAKS